MSVLPSITCHGHLLPLILSGFLLSFSFLRLLFLSQQCTFRIHVFSSPVEHILHGFQVILVQGKQKLTLP